MSTTLRYGLILSLLFLATLIIPACTNDTPVEDETNLPTDPELLAQMAHGQELMEAACYACHNPDQEMKGRLAPPMAAVKGHYIDETTSFSSFSSELVRFVQRPSKGYAKMPGAINVFGLMPVQPHDEEDLRAIAAYIYHGDLAKPDWLDDHQREEMKRNRKRFGHDKPFVQRGRQYALQTKSVLGANLMQAIKAGGPESAVPFCNTRALPLTDSMAVAQGVSIRRVSDRARNPLNVADSLELVQIDALREDLRLGIETTHRLVESEDMVTGYYPITTNDMCLKCHGKKGTDVAPATLSVLEALYPEDRANELRGIWVVEMPKEE